MIIIMKPNVSEKAIKKATNPVESKGFQAHLLKGDEVTTVGAVGDKMKLAGLNIEISEGVDKVVAVIESYKLVNKKLHPEDSVIPASNTYIGPGNLTIMAGPCTTENKEQLMEAAFAVKRVGATFLRGGVYKPRTSPYLFQDLEEEGLKYMKEACEATGLNVICEVTGQRATEAAAKYVDMLQIGAWNMQNFELPKEAGKSGVPVSLERGLTATIDERLNAAEYVISEGDLSIVLYERGIRTSETATRNMLDISAVLVLKAKSHLPITVDPSYTTDMRAYAEPLAKCTMAVGADSLMIEVYPCPEHALPDGPQSLTLEQLDALMKGLVSFAELAGRSFKE